MGKSKVPKIVIDKAEYKMRGSSFLSCQSEMNEFKYIRVPSMFNAQYGNILNKQDITLLCNEANSWNAYYDKDSSRISGVLDFSKAHKIKMYCLLKLEYIGNLTFKVKVFTPYGIELSYSNVESGLCKNRLLERNFNSRELCVGISNVEEQKAKALLMFNGCGQMISYPFKIYSHFLSQSRKTLVIDEDLKDLYKDWKHGDIVTLKINENMWKIKIEKIDDKFWRFGNGWFEFGSEVGLGHGDELILYQGSHKHEVCGCIFEPNAHKLLNQYKVSGNPNSSTSFFVFATEDSINAGKIVVPRQFSRHYKKILKDTRYLECAGQTWLFGGMLLCDKKVIALHHVMSFVKLEKNDTLIFSFEERAKVNLRIFQADGMEISYSTSRSRLYYTSSDHWFIHSTWSEVNLHTVASDNEMEMLDVVAEEEKFIQQRVDARNEMEMVDNVVEDDTLIEEDNTMIEFHQQLKKSHIDRKSDGVVNMMKSSSEGVKMNQKPSVVSKSAPLDKVTKRFDKVKYNVEKKMEKCQHFTMRNSNKIEPLDVPRCWLCDSGVDDIVFSSPTIDPPKSHKASLNQLNGYTDHQLTERKVRETSTLRKEADERSRKIILISKSSAALNNHGILIDADDKRKTIKVRSMKELLTEANYVAKDTNTLQKEADKSKSSASLNNDGILINADDRRKTIKIRSMAEQVTEENNVAKGPSPSKGGGQWRGKEAKYNGGWCGSLRGIRVLGGPINS